MTVLKPLAIQLRDEIEYGDTGMFRKYLVKDQKRQVMLICLRAGIHIPEHASAHDGFLTVIQGQGIFLLSGREVTLEPGVFIELPAKTLHAFTILENLTMLKVVDHHESSATEAPGETSACQAQTLPHQPAQPPCAELLVTMLEPYLQEWFSYRTSHHSN